MVDLERLIRAPVIAIDGPSASGKGTVAQRVAAGLGFHYLDSGALYRLLVVRAIRQGISTDDATALSHLAAELPATFCGDSICLDGRDVTGEVRSEQTGNMASQVAALPQVREALLARQRAYRQQPGLVADGRDMGSVVFPDAALKIFLTATAEERAQRRVKQLKEKGLLADDTGDIFTRILQDIRSRDARDANRAVAPLKQLPDAHRVDTTSLTVEQAVEAIVSLFPRSPA